MDVASLNPTPAFIFYNKNSSHSNTENNRTETVDTPISKSADVRLTGVSVAPPATRKPGYIVKPLVYEPVASQKLIRFSRSLENSANLSLETAVKRYSDPSQRGYTTRALGDLITNGSNSFHQYAQLSIAPLSMELGALDSEYRPSSTAKNLAELKLSLKTKDGDEIKFSYSLQPISMSTKDGESYQYQGVVVDFELDGELSDEEKSQVAEFAMKLSLFASEFFLNPEKGADLDRLGLFEGDQFSSLSLELKGSDAELSLNLHDDDESRKINIQWKTDITKWKYLNKQGRANNELQLLLDKTGSSDVTSIRQEQSLRMQQDLISETLREGHAKDQQQNFISAAFKSIHHDISMDTPSGDLPNMLTELADYSISFSGELIMPMQGTDFLDKDYGSLGNALKNNQNSRLQEGINTFKLEQKTSISEKDEKLKISQEQNVELDASYFAALPHLDNPDFANQSFMFHNIQHKQSILTEEVLDDTSVVSAMISKSVDHVHSVTEYSEGVREDVSHRDKHQYEIVDATEILQNIKQRSMIESLDALLDMSFNINH